MNENALVVIPFEKLRDRPEVLPLQLMTVSKGVPHLEQDHFLRSACRFGMGSLGGSGRQ